MQAILTSAIAQISGGKTEHVSYRAEDIVNGLTKIDTTATKFASQLDRLKEDFELVKLKARNR